MTTTLTSPSSPTHDLTCTECGVLFACACSMPEKDRERMIRGWKVLCPTCNTKEMEAWYQHMRTYPEQYDTIFRAKP